MSNTLTIPL